jgi:hypothetical protein
MNEVPETTQLDVNLPKPRTRKVLIGALVTVLVLGIVGLAAAAIANRAAQSPDEATAGVMPANTMLYVALNTQADQLPNFNAIANAWSDSKEARMLVSALQLGVTQAGFNWEDDIRPWLGERVALGIVDLGGVSAADPAQQVPAQYRAPFFIISAQTKDHAKSEAFLIALSKQLSKTGLNQTVQTETYRNIPVSYLSSSGAEDSSVAWATIEDNVVLTTSRDNLKTVINAALDKQGLSTSENFKTVMGSLPVQSVGAAYVDYNRYMDELLQLTQSMQNSADSIAPTLDPKRAEEFKQQREKLLRQQEAQLAQLRDMTKALGGVGATMSYEPTGIRFDTAMQFDPAQLPADQRQLYEAALSPASGRAFAALPASAILAADFNLKGGFLSKLLNPEILAAQAASSGVSEDEIAAKLDEFQKATGVNLQSDVLDLLNGDAAFAILARDQQKSDALSYSLPVEFALLLDASDAGRLTSSFDKIFQGLSASSGTGHFTWQSLSGLPFSVVLADGEPVVTYGAVDGRVAIGTDSNTLLGIDNADQAALANDATFKQATGLLPGNRLNTAYLNLQSLWNLIPAQGKSDTSTGMAAVLNYLGHFKWVSSGAEAPANGLSRGSLHIGVAK